MTGPGATPRLGSGEAVAAGCAVLLLITLFALAWFGTVGTPGRVLGAGLQGSEDGWNGLTILRWLILLDIIAAVGCVALHISQIGRATLTRTGYPLLALAGPVAGLVSVRVLIDLPDPARVIDAKFGGYLGMLLCLGIALGAWSAAQEERERPASDVRPPRTAVPA